MRRVNRCCITVFELVLNSFDVDPVPVVSLYTAIETERTLFITIER
jgi:hypothetical protein